jgi:cell wall assembly regulator SMI1
MVDIFEIVKSEWSDLQSPPTQESLRQLDSGFQSRLPAEIRSLYELHDGFDFGAIRLMPIAEALKFNEFSGTKIDTKEKAQNSRFALSNKRKRIN